MAEAPPREDLARPLLQAGARPACEAEHAELRGAAVLATDTALDVVTQAFRFAGGSAVYDTSPLQRCLRDLNAGAQHFMVSASAYDALGRFLLHLPSHPME